jgi:cell shape-determining protein MreD
MPYIPLLDSFYDLLIPFIVYLGLVRPVRESIPLVILLGFIMDNISGGPFGLYLTIYFWMFVGVKGITAFIQVGNRLVIITLIIVISVLFENLILLGTFAASESSRQLAGDAAKIVAGQVLWAIFSGALFLIFFKNAHNRIGAGLKALYARKSEQG